MTLAIVMAGLAFGAAVTGAEIEFNRRTLPRIIRRLSETQTGPGASLARGYQNLLRIEPTLRNGLFALALVFGLAAGVAVLVHWVTT
jgi:hypothetical protein